MMMTKKVDSFQIRLKFFIEERHYCLRTNTKTLFRSLFLSFIALFKKVHENVTFFIHFWWDFHE